MSTAALMMRSSASVETSSSCNDVEMQVPTTSMHDVVRLNNQGVALVFQHQDDQAVACFSKALGVLKQQLLVDDSDQEQETEFSSVLHQALVPLHELQTEDFFLYHGMVTFAENDDTRLRHSDYHVYCASIILNIALLYHRQAASPFSYSEEALAKAERFYTMVSKVLGDAANYGTALVVKLGAINNMAGIRLEKLQDAADSFQTITWLVSESEQDDSCCLQTSVLEGMLLNALVANRPRVAAPAA